MTTQTEKNKLFLIEVPFSEVVHGVEYFNVEAKDINSAIDLIKNGDVPVCGRDELEYGTYNMYMDDMEVIEELDDNEDD
jgi:hypothetical protein